ncbi:hypothetical protein [Streptomyces anandii]|uniref:hypothetical protein n=1 Tax=Streptomyces anandii TaxID=285454 RepID=UPI003789A381
MTTEGTRVPAPRGDDPLVTAGLEIAMKWGAALGGPEQLKVALGALEPQLKREHQLRLKEIEARRQDAERRARVQRELLQHRFKMASLIIGSLMSVAMLGAGVYVAPRVWWLAMLLCGPSLIAVMKIVVLRRSDRSDMAAVASIAKGITNAAGQGQPPV